MEIVIDYSPEEIEKSRQRMEAVQTHKYIDRVPVSFCMAPRFYPHLLGFEYGEYFKDAKTQFYWQLQIAKFTMENIRSDQYTTTTLYVHPYFDNVIPSSAFGCEVRWQNDETLHAMPVLKTIGDAEKMPIPEVDAALWGRAAGWWYEMQELAKDVKVTFPGGVEGHVEVAPLSLTSMGPGMIAVDLAGENFYWWLLDDPEACHRFLRKITDGLIRIEDYTRKIDPRPRGFGLAEDTSTIMSPKMFKEFIVPYDLELYRRYSDNFVNGRSMHMCGNSTHLHSVLRDDLGVQMMAFFGYQVNPKVAADNLSATTLLMGNIDPMTMLGSDYQTVRAHCLRTLEGIAPTGALILADGANPCPHTPIENMNALMDAAIAYGLPKGTSI